MIYPIYVYGSTVLREQAVEINSEYPDLAKLIKNMFDTMYDADGVGLAAPQIGKSIKLFTVDLSPLEDDYPELKDFVKVFINPNIYEYSEEVSSREEGCLSLPGLNEDVIRPNSVKITYLDENFVEHDEEYTGFAARAIQHEYDHLDGVVFADKVALLRKTLMRNKLNAMSKGKFKARYRTKQKK